MKPLRVEIVTPVHNRRDDTLRCLRSIARSRADRLSIHVIVVDDGSDDGTAESVRREFPETEIVNGDGNLWYTAGTNRGIEAAMKHDPDYVLAINNDQIFHEDCISQLVMRAETSPGSVVGALLLRWDTPHKVFQVSPRWELAKGGFRHWYRQTVWTVPPKAWRLELIVGNCVLYPIKAIRDVGLMDEKRLPQYGDAEYTPRMRKKGWLLLVEPRAWVFCKPNDEITGFRAMPFSRKIRNLFLEPTGPYSLRRRIFANIGGAPNFFEGALAVPIGLLRIAAGRSYETSWAASQPEPPLSDIFRSAVVDD